MTNKATKSTNVTSMVSTEESPEFKRRRMKEVRTMVAKAVANGKRVDLMGFEGSDIARSQIALQDLLTKSQERHKKATERLASTNQMGLVIADVLDHAADKMMSDQERIGELSTALYNERVGHNQTAQSLNQCHKSYHQAMMDLDTVKRAQEILND